MKKFIGFLISFAVVMMFMTPLSHAFVDAEGLTKEQEAQIQLQIEQIKKEGQSKATVETANEWVDLGKNVALAFTTVAKDLGVAADSFLQSTTGKVTLVLIVWKVAGKDIIGVIIGVIMMIAFTTMWVYFFRRLCIVKSVVIKTPETGFKKVKEVRYYNEDEVVGTRVTMLFILIIEVLVSLIVIFA